MGRLIGRLAAALLVASLVSPHVVAFRVPRAQPRDVSPERAAGMDAPAGPVVSALAATPPAALGAPLSVVPRVLAAAHLVVTARLAAGNVRPAFVVKSAPTILRV